MTSVFAALLFGTACFADADFPWAVADPAQEGASKAKLEAVRERLAAHKTKAFLVVRHDRIVYEWYSPGNGPHTLCGTASLAKALVGGTSLLVAIDDRRIGPDDLACKYIPAWKGDPVKSRITIRHLATHSSGIEDAEEGDKRHEELTGWKGDFWKRQPDPFSIAIHEAPVVFPPGTRYAYSNPGMAALAYAVTASLRGAPQTDMRTLLRERIMDPLGIPPDQWDIGYGRTYEVDGLKLYANWGGGRYTPRATARVGQLMLHQGRWNGRQIVARASVRRMVAFVPPSLPWEGTVRKVAPALCWWTNILHGWPNVPRDLIRGGGAGNQLLYVIPSLDLIIVRYGEWLDPANPDSEIEYVLDPVLDAFSGASQSERPAAYRR